MKKGYISDHSVDLFSQQFARSESANASLLQFSELRRKGEGRSKKKGQKTRSNEPPFCVDGCIRRIFNREPRCFTITIVCSSLALSNGRKKEVGRRWRIRWKREKEKWNVVLRSESVLQRPFR